MSCNRPSVRRYVSISPQLFSPYPNGTRVQFDCISPSKAGSRVPLKKFGSSWATCNGASGSWTFEDTNHAPHCESDVGDFESKLQIVVTVFACSLMACLVFLMFTFGFKAYNYRRDYKKIRVRQAGKPPSYRDVILNPHSYPHSNESLAASCSSTITVFTSDLPSPSPSPSKPSIRSTTKAYSPNSNLDDLVSEESSSPTSKEATGGETSPPPYSEVKREIEGSLPICSLPEAEETDL